MRKFIVSLVVGAALLVVGNASAAVQNNYCTAYVVKPSVTGGYIYTSGVASCTRSTYLKARLCITRPNGYTKCGAWSYRWGNYIVPTTSPRFYCQRWAYRYWTAKIQAAAQWYGVWYPTVRYASSRLACY